MKRVVFLLFQYALLVFVLGSTAFGAPPETSPADAATPPLSQGNAALSQPLPAVNASAPSLAPNSILRPQLHFSPLVWVQIRQGLSVGKSFLVSSSSHREDSGFTLIRIDPASYRFSLHMASHDAPARSLGMWAEKYELHAGINASMYLPDNMTSTGYMRGGTHINNVRIGSRLGAFFVANPHDPSLAAVDILEGHKPETLALLEKYDIVVQNYRLISSQGNILWPEGGAMHSIAAVAKEQDGAVLFILCQDPLTAYEFARAVQAFSLQLGTVMYVEGGAQAGVFVKNVPSGSSPAAQGIPTGGAEASPGATLAGAVPGVGPENTYTVLKGRQSLLFFKGNEGAPLPNIIGVRPLEE